MTPCPDGPAPVRLVTHLEPGVHARREPLLLRDRREERRELPPFVLAQRLAQRLPVLACDAGEVPERRAPASERPPATYLLPVVRFPDFAWLIAAGALLPRGRKGARASVPPAGSAVAIPAGLAPRQRE